MCSPISLIVANLYMEHFESRALETAPTRPAMCYRYVNDTLTYREHGSTKVTVYRKPTHTDQYLNFHSNHHLQHKRAVVNTLLLRGQTLVSEEIDRVTEIRHVKQALKANNYPDWMITLPNAAPVSRVPEESVKERGIYASVPYIKGTSERPKEHLNHTRSHLSTSLSIP